MNEKEDISIEDIEKDRIDSNDRLKPLSFLYTKFDLNEELSPENSPIHRFLVVNCIDKLDFEKKESYSLIEYSELFIRYDVAKKQLERYRNMSIFSFLKQRILSFIKKSK